MLKTLEFSRVFRTRENSYVFISQDEIYLVFTEKQEGQVALNCSPEFCLKLIYRNLLRADYVPGDTLGQPFLAPSALFEQTWSCFSLYRPL